MELRASQVGEGEVGVIEIKDGVAVLVVFGIGPECPVTQVEGGRAVDHTAASIFRDEVAGEHAEGTLGRGCGGTLGVRGYVRGPTGGALGRFDGARRWLGSPAGLTSAGSHLGALLCLEVIEGRRVLPALECLAGEGLAQHLVRGRGLGVGGRAMG